MAAQNLAVAVAERELLGPAAGVHVRAGLALRRHAVDGPDRLAVDEDDALVAPRHVREELLRDQGLAADAGEELVERVEVAVVRVEPEHPRPAVAVERLQDDVAMPRLERLQRREVAGDGGRRRQLGEVEHQELLGVVAHPEWVVDNQRARVDAVEDVGGGDVAHVEGRVLAQPDHVLARRGRWWPRAQREVVALPAAHLDRPAAGGDPALVERQPVGGVVEQPVPARLRLLHDPEGGIGGDVDPLDRIHLDGDVQGHGRAPRARVGRQSWPSAARACKPTSRRSSRRSRCAPAGPCVDQREVEAAGHGPVGVLGQVAAWRRRRCAPIAAASTGCGGRMAAAGLDLDEDDLGRELDHEVELALRAAPARRRGRGRPRRGSGGRRLLGGEAGEMGAGGMHGRSLHDDDATGERLSQPWLTG